jgi:hypothetical protein
MAGKKQAFKDILRDCFPVVIDDLLPDTGKEESTGESPSLPTATLGEDTSQESVSRAKNKTVSSRDTVSSQDTVSREDTVSHGTTVSPSVTVPAPDTVAATETVSGTGTVSPDDTASVVASVEISSNCFKMDADVFDILAEFQTPYERIVYLYLYRQSYGYCRQTCFAGLKPIIDHCKFSKNVVRRALETLESKQHIKRLARVNERDLKGTTYRVFLPCEIPDIRSQTKISILQDDHSILP